LVAAARRVGCSSIAYTYTEPTVFFEFAFDTARLARQYGLANILVTNGYMTHEALDTIAPYLDAANVDLKSFRDQTYRKYTGARLAPVLASLRTMIELGIWVEVTTLVIPGVNDQSTELREMARFISNELGPDTPWHLSRFAPAHRMQNIAATPLATLERAQKIGGEAGLRYVYLGNVPRGSNTRCHHCGHLLIRRSGLRSVRRYIPTDGSCPQCGTHVAGRWLAGHSCT
jgi:pyruvate formate lyase activating enzyme